MCNVLADDRRAPSCDVSSSDVTVNGEIKECFEKCVESKGKKEHSSKALRRKIAIFRSSKANCGQAVQHFKDSYWECDTTFQNDTMQDFPHSSIPDG